MSEVKARSVFIHLDLPGQDDNAPDLPEDYAFPTIQQMGEPFDKQVKLRMTKALSSSEGEKQCLLLTTGIFVYRERRSRQKNVVFQQ